MSAAPLLSNVPFFECLPIGMSVLDSALRVAYVNGWMRRRLGEQESPRELNDMASWGGAEWREFLRGVPGMKESGARVEGNFWLSIGAQSVGAGEVRGMQVTVSF